VVDAWCIRSPRLKNGYPAGQVAEVRPREVLRSTIHSVLGPEMKPGDIFNPWRGACGFYPPDAVSALGKFTIVRTRRKFSDRHKLLYIRLVRRWGRGMNGCFPLQKHLATSLGVPERTIRRLIEDLEEFGLISRRARGRGYGGRGQTDEYTFLWHLIFDRPKPPFMTGQNGHFDRPKPNGPYKEETRTSETQNNETRQHHQGDDAACNPEEEEIIELGGVRCSAANLKALREFVSAGIPIDQIRGGVALGRLRHMSNPAAGPIASFRFFTNPIAEAGEAYDADQLEHTIHRLKRELSRRGAEPGAGAGAKVA
jgi:hypothetical protein